MENLFFENDESQFYLSPAYIGSFTVVEKNNLLQQKDDPYLWRTYGKHDGEEAAGSCLIFKRMCFAEEHELQIGIMERVNLIENLQMKQDPRLLIYRIYYEGSREAEELDLAGELEEMAELLKEAGEYVRNFQQKDDLIKLFRELLDSIRFLFKANSYSKEREVRLLSIHYCQYEENTARNPDGIKIDKEQVPHRFYIEVPKSCRFSEVILGPKAKEVGKWKRWIKDQDPELSVEKSRVKPSSLDS